MRSHYCGHVDESYIGQQVTVCGWVHRRRDHGGVILLICVIGRVSFRW